MVDAISSYGVKSILHWNIITHVYKEHYYPLLHIGTLLPIITHYSKVVLKYAFTFSSVNINVNAVGFKRINKNEMPIKNSIMQHFFDNKPSSEKVFIRKYLRDCEQRLNFNFIINA